MLGLLILNRAHLLNISSTWAVDNASIVRSYRNVNPLSVLSVKVEHCQSVIES